MGNNNAYNTKTAMIKMNSQILIKTLIRSWDY